MKIRQRRANELIASIGLTLFVIYVTLNISTVFFGYLSKSYNKYVMATISLVGSLLLLAKLAKARLTPNEIISIALFGSLTWGVLGQLYIYPETIDTLGRSSHTFLITNYAYNIAFFILGYILTLNNNIQYSNLSSYVIVSSIALVILTHLSGQLVIDYHTLASETGQEKLNHLSAGSSFYLAFALAYSLSYGWKKQLLVFIISGLLFLLGGRADLVIFICTAASIEILRTRSMTNIAIKTVMLLLIGMAAWLVLRQIQAPSGMLGKMLFSEGIAADGSFQERLRQLYSGLKSFPNIALFGNVAGLVHVNNTYSFGTAIHNLLSAWQFYGAPALLMLCFVLIRLLNTAIIANRSLRRPMIDLGIFLYLSGVIGVLIAKDVNTILLWIGIGYFTGYSNTISRNPLYNSPRNNKIKNDPNFRA